jgi:hypothetical protein
MTENYGGTEIPSALSKYDIRYGIVVTDDDGWNQITNQLRAKHRPKVSYIVGTNVSVILSKDGRSSHYGDFSSFLISSELNQISRKIMQHVTYI